MQKTKEVNQYLNLTLDIMASDNTTASPAGTSNGDDETSIINALTERLHFFFSNANLRQDKWMRTQLSTSPTHSLSIDTLLKFNTLKSITTSKELVAKAAQGDSLKELIKYDKDEESVGRVVPFDFKTMGDGSKLSLYVKNVPLTEPPKQDDENEEEGDDEEGKDDDENKADDTTQKFRPRYAVTRDELKSLFEQYGRIGIIQLKYGRKSSTSSNDEEKYTSPSTGRGYNRGESYPMGVAIVEFENEDGIDKACKDLLPQVDNDDDGDDDEKKAEPKTVLEIKGNKLIIEKMKPHRFFKDKNGSQKRSRDSVDGDTNEDDNQDKNDKEEEEEEVNFEPITLDWEKGCVIALTGLSTTSCDRESIREAVSETLGVSTDVKTSGLYVDYNRGASMGNLRLKEPKPTEMKELVDKLSDGTITIANEKVGSATILEGEKEEEYWKEFIVFLNNRKKMREEEKRMNSRNNKRQRFSGGGRGRGGRGRR